jgi:hypothetical protein
MMEQNTKKTLEDLHGQLSNIQLEDETKQKHLTEITHAVRASLDEPDSPHRLTLRERLEKAAVVFEVDHPQIAHTLHAAIDSLSEAGF